MAERAPERSAHHQAREAQHAWRHQRPHRHHHRGFPPWLALAAILTLAGGGVLLVSFVALLALVAVGAVLLGMYAIQAFRRPELAATAPPMPRFGADTYPSLRSASRATSGLPALLATQYARGEIGAAEFRRHLMDLLKMRYVRGEISLTEYEAHLTHLLRDPLLG